MSPLFGTIGSEKAVAFFVKKAKENPGKGGRTRDHPSRGIFIILHVSEVLPNVCQLLPEYQQ